MHEEAEELTGPPIHSVTGMEFRGAGISFKMPTAYLLHLFLGLFWCICPGTL